jgi:hypothetical protein
MLVSRLAYSSTLKMEVACSSETSVEFKRTTRHYIPEYRTLKGNYQFLKEISVLWSYSETYFFNIFVQTVRQTVDKRLI